MNCIVKDESDDHYTGIDHRPTRQEWLESERNLDNKCQREKPQLSTAIPDGHSQGTHFQAVTHKTRGRKSGTGRNIASVKVRIEPLKV